MFSRDVRRWRGVLLVALAVVATLILAATDRLVFYIHPRYSVFTVVMVTLALALVVASLLVPTKDTDEDAPQGRAGRVLGMVASVVAGVVALTMVVLPPATLTSSTAQQRDMNSTASGAASATVDEAANASAEAFARFTVLDWASLLRQTSDASFYTDKPVDVTGFVVADPTDPENIFFVSRFFVTCCAVDAQPAGVPVWKPGWAEQFAEDSWVRVTGTFVISPSTGSAEPLAIVPDQVIAVEVPREPYLF